MSWINIDAPEDDWSDAPYDNTEHLRRQMMDIMAPIMKQATETARQEALRERYPALREAWENYQMVLRLIDGETAGE